VTPKTVFALGRPSRTAPPASGSEDDAYLNDAGVAEIRIEGAWTIEHVFGTVMSPTE
jgi:hypothetical protein